MLSLAQNGAFTAFVHTTPENFENATTTEKSGFVFEDSGTDYGDVIDFESSVFNFFRSN